MPRVAKQRPHHKVARLSSVPYSISSTQTKTKRTKANVKQAWKKWIILEEGDYRDPEVMQLIYLEENRSTYQYLPRKAHMRNNRRVPASLEWRKLRAKSRNQKQAQADVRILSPLLKANAKAKTKAASAAAAHIGTQSKKNKRKRSPAASAAAAHIGTQSKKNKRKRSPAASAAAPVEPVHQDTSPAPTHWAVGAPTMTTRQGKAASTSGALCDSQWHETLKNDCEKYTFEGLVRHVAYHNPFNAERDTKMRRVGDDVDSSDAMDTAFKKEKPLEYFKGDDELENPK